MNDILSALGIKAVNAGACAGAAGWITGSGEQLPLAQGVKFDL